MRELVHAGEIEVRYVTTKLNAADILTKSSLDSTDYNLHVSNIMNTTS